MWKIEKEPFWTLGGACNIVSTCKAVCSKNNNKPYIYKKSNLINFLECQCCSWCFRHVEKVQHTAKSHHKVERHLVLQSEFVGLCGYTFLVSVFLEIKLIKISIIHKNRSVSLFVSWWKLKQSCAIGIWSFWCCFKETFWHFQNGVFWAINVSAPPPSLKKLGYIKHRYYGTSVRKQGVFQIFWKDKM